MTAQPLPQPSADQPFTEDELVQIDKSAREVIGGDQIRYARVMAEIDENERKARVALREILIRRAVVEKAGHL
jgi:hypothetical protein